MDLSIAYFTNRKDPRFYWFADSLKRQLQPSDSIRLIVVDYWAQANPQSHHNWTDEDVETRKELFLQYYPDNLLHIPPKPTVWQGPYRLTSRDYFAAANARNTALCFCETDWVAFVDDLSVLLPGWLERTRRAMQDNGQITLGSYKKVKRLQVKDGLVESFSLFEAGVDSRLKSDYVLQYSREHGEDCLVPASGGWMFGCSLVAPVEAFLQVNGFDEDNDSQGGEDYLCGMMLERKGWRLVYDRQLATLEDEDAHYEEEPFLRIIKKGPAFEARFPRPLDHEGEWDASHAILRQVLQGERLTAPNPSLGEGGLRGLWQLELGCLKFSLPSGAELHWPDSQPLKEM